MGQVVHDVNIGIIKNDMGYKCKREMKIFLKKGRQQMYRQSVPKKKKNPPKNLNVLEMILLYL